MPSELQSKHESDQLAPASQSNRSRQNRSRLNITHPIRFVDDDLETRYNRKRSIPKSDRKSELSRLH